MQLSTRNLTDYMERGVLPSKKALLAHITLWEPALLLLFVQNWFGNSFET